MPARCTCRPACLVWLLHTSLTMAHVQHMHRGAASAKMKYRTTETMTAIVLGLSLAALTVGSSGASVSFGAALTNHAVMQRDGAGSTVYGRVLRDGNSLDKVRVAMNASCWPAESYTIGPGACQSLMDGVTSVHHHTGHAAR
jgi:hypothetical protein